MIIELDLARAMTAGSQWSDPNAIKGGKPILTPEDIRIAVSIALVDHPFAFHALMAKYCDNLNSELTLHKKMDEYGALLFLRTYPNFGLKGRIHNKIIEFSIKVFYTPLVYARLNESIGSKGVNLKAAQYIGVHKDTWRIRYLQHFNLMTNLLFELELTALENYKRIMWSS
jgi:hypothetical protein